MFRLAAVIYVLVGTVFMGGAVTAVLATPSLADDFGKWIVVSAGVGAALAFPISYVIAKAIMKQVKKS